VWNTPDADLVQQCTAGLEKMSPGVGSRILGSRVVRVPLAYPVYRTEYEQDRQQFEKSTGIAGLLSVGRNGEFAHILMEDVYWKTRWKLAEYLYPTRQTAA
jgi:protoporphyrinogen oxidase